LVTGESPTEKKRRRDLGERRPRYSMANRRKASHKIKKKKNGSGMAVRIPGVQNIRIASDMSLAGHLTEKRTRKVLGGDKRRKAMRASKTPKHLSAQPISKKGDSW